MYQRPKEDDDYYQQAERASNSSRVKNWKKDKDEDIKLESETFSSESKDTNVEKISDSKEADKKADKNENKTDVLSEAEMNKLGARIVKAEIMGDEVCFAILLSASFYLQFHIY